MMDPENTEHNVSKMTKNVIGHGKGLRKELLKLALEIRKCTTNNSPKKKRIACFNEFRDDFNPCNGNIVSNSITLHALSIIPIDSTVDSNEHAHHAATEYEHKESMIIETHCNKTLNKMMNPNNNNFFAARSSKNS